MTTPTDEQPASVADALTREHHEIDAGIEAFVASVGAEQKNTDITEWAAPLLAAMTALRRHIYLEEEFVFPPIRQGGLMMPIMVMLREHGELWRAMDELAELLETAVDDPARHEEMVSRCAQMLDLLETHNSKEEPIIYPHADADLSAEARAELHDFLRRGRMPAGWVCERAAAGYVCSTPRRCHHSTYLSKYLDIEITWAHGGGNGIPHLDRASHRSRRPRRREPP